MCFEMVQRKARLNGKLFKCSVRIKNEIEIIKYFPLIVSTTTNKTKQQIDSQFNKKIKFIQMKH